MKFRNASGDDLFVPSLGVIVLADQDTPELNDAQAAGFILQSAVWQADDQAAQAAAVEAATTPAPADVPAPAVETPAPAVMETF